MIRIIFYVLCVFMIINCSTIKPISEMTQQEKCSIGRILAHTEGRPGFFVEPDGSLSLVVVPDKGEKKNSDTCIISEEIGPCGQIIQKVDIDCDGKMDAMMLWLVVIDKNDDMVFVLSKVVETKNKKELNL